MNEAAKALQPLRRKLPEIPGVPEIDEDGETIYPGFNGDCSQSPLYVTDGHILLLASAIDPTVTIARDEDRWAAKHATEAGIGDVWKPAETRNDLIADFIGVCGYPARPWIDEREVAFLRDPLGRVMAVNAHLLAFGVRAVHPDVLTVSAAPIGRWFDSPLALRRDGKLVGLLMPMRLDADDFMQYDLHGEPVDLTDQGRMGSE